MWFSTADRSSATRGIGRAQSSPRSWACACAGAGTRAGTGTTCACACGWARPCSCAGVVPAARARRGRQARSLTPEEAAAQATRAGAKQLVLNHIVPPMPVAYAYPAFLGDAAKFFDKPITVGEDGMLFSLPAGSTDIHRSKLN